MTSDDFNDFTIDDPDPTVSTINPVTNETAPAGSVRTKDGWVLPPQDGPLSSLNDEQRVRVGALNMAKPLLATKSLLGATGAVDLSDLIRLASWILDGNEEPLYPFVSGSSIILGPDLYVSVDGDAITWKDTTYLKGDNDEN